MIAATVGVRSRTMLWILRAIAVQLLKVDEESTDVVERVGAFRVAGEPDGLPRGRSVVRRLDQPPGEPPDEAPSGLGRPHRDRISPRRRASSRRTRPPSSSL